MRIGAPPAAPPGSPPGARPMTPQGHPTTSLKGSPLGAGGHPQGLPQEHPGYSLSHSIQYLFLVKQALELEFRHRLFVEGQNLSDPGPGSYSPVSMPQATYWSDLVACHTPRILSDLCFAMVFTAVACPGVNAAEPSRGSMDSHWCPCCGFALGRLDFSERCGVSRRRGVSGHSRM